MRCLKWNRQAIWMGLRWFIDDKDFSRCLGIGLHGRMPESIGERTVSKNIECIELKSEAQPSP